MSSWSLLEAASGYSYDAATATIGFAPVISPERFRAPFVARDGWGTVEQTVQEGRQTLRLRPVAGSLTIATLQLHAMMVVRQCIASLDGAPLAVHLAEMDRLVSIEFTEPAMVAAAQTLEVVVRG
jgi:hypothetical protein